MSLTHKKIILGVSGGIAAYKAAELCRLLVKAGADVQVAMTAAAQQFVTALTFQALSGKSVQTDLWQAANGTSKARCARSPSGLARRAEAVTSLSHDV